MWGYAAFSVSVLKINEKSLCFGLFGQKKQFEDGTFGSGKLRWAFLALCWHGIINRLSVKVFGRLIDNGNNC